MTPTMHDARAARLRGKPQEPRDTYYNGVLSLYGAWLREVAQVRGLGYVDMYSPLNNLTLEQRKKEPNYTLIKDAVHPDAPGQVVMATALITDSGVRSAVSGIVVSETKGKMGASAAGGKVTDLKATDGGVSFNFQASALPWVLPRDAAEGYKLTFAGHRSSNEKVTCRNLKPGKYELKIDGQTIGTYADGQLAFGVEIEANDKTPQYQQALAIAMLNKDRNDQAVHPLRNWWGQLKGKRRQLDVLKGAQTPDKEAAAEALKTATAAFEQWQEQEFKPGVEKSIALAKEFEEKIYAANKVPARKYELMKVQ